VVPAVAGVASWDALSVLTAAGLQTPGIELGTGVLVAQTQHPLALARAALTVSAAIQRRLLLGVGVSHRPFVTDVFGYPYDAPATFLREYLQVLNPALAGRPVDHHGARITAVGQIDVPCPSPPTLIAAALGPRMLKIAGELTDGTMTCFTHAKVVEMHIVPRITAAARAAGRAAPQVVVALPVAVTEDAESLRNDVAVRFSHYGNIPAYRAMLDMAEVDGVADACMIGDETEVRAQVRRIADAGATEFSVVPIGDSVARARTAELLLTST
jgi:F420-dependent oxidoreductase-like protein